LAERPEDRLVFGRSDVDGGQDATHDAPDGHRLVEHEFHGRKLTTVVGSGTVAGGSGVDGRWRKCAVWCWGERCDESEGGEA
jgi:hypothetical protein